VKRRREEVHAEPAAPVRNEPAPSPPYADLLRLQRSAGNQAVGQLLRQPAPVVVAPKTDEQQWEDDWNDAAFAGARAHFAGPDRPSGTPKQRYDVLCPLYKAQGILRPLKYVHDNIVTGTFFGHSSPMHKDLRTKLNTAQKALNDAGVTDAPFTKLWAFNPRTQSGGQWSNHADGKAIDFDENTNPRLINAKQNAVISALTEMDITASNPGAKAGMTDSYDASAEASLRFQSRYSAVGLAERSEEIYDDEHALEAEEKEIADKLGVLGKVAKPTADQKNEAKALRNDLKAKQAQIRANLAAQKAIGGERDRVLALEKAVDDLEKAIDTLQTEIDALDATKDAKKIAAKAALMKVKQKQLAAATTARDDDPMRKLANTGFLDLDKQMVEALKATGLRWGGNYTGSKDYMHFELV
jgi:hypothetical protein